MKFFMSWYKNLLIGRKLIFSFLFVSLIAAITGFIAITGLNTLSNRYSSLYNDNIIPLEDVGIIREQFTHIDAIIKDQLLSNDSIYLLAKSKECNELMQKNEDLLKHYKATTMDETESALNIEFDSYKNKFDNVFATVNNLLASGNKVEASNYFVGKEASGVRKGYRNTLLKIFDYNIKAAKEEVDETTIIANNTILLTIILTIVGLIVSIGFGFLIAGIIKKPIAAVLNMTKEMQKGHMKARASVESNDEIGEMAKNLDVFADQVDKSICGALRKIAAGDVDFESSMADEQDEIAPALNKAIGSIKAVLAETDKLTQAAIEGDLSMRGNSSGFEGGFKRIVDGMNNTLDEITQPVKDSLKVLEIMSNGDLTIRMNGEYKGDHKLVKDCVNNLGNALEHALMNVNESIQATASAATEISSSSEQMAAGAQEQSQQTTEVAGAIEEMSKTIYDASKLINNASDLSKQASNNVKNGVIKLDNTKKGMQKIVEFSQVTYEMITSLAGQTDQIGEITQVIDDIADQTNLLALNAAIEAARAGEQGRGFAVVADEVRKLAERTTKATKEIAETIKTIQKEAKSADGSMLEAKKAVDEGMKLTEEVDSVLQEILIGSEKVLDIISQVAAGGEEQSATAEQISKNIEGVANVTNESAAGVEQIAHAAEDLNRLTVNLQDTVAAFKLTGSDNSRFISAGKKKKYLA